MVVGIVLEAFLLLGYFFAGLAGFIVPLTSVKRESQNRPSVVFVHGWLTQNPLYYRLKRSLERRGINVYMTNFGVQLGDINRVARRLGDYMAARNLKDVTLVGASLGAVICLAHLQSDGGWSGVRRFVAIAGPFHGTPLARLVVWSKAGRQMLPRSEFVERLFADGIRNADRITCIRARIDELVPSASSELPGSTTLAIDVIGHVRVQAFSREVYEKIAERAVED